MTPCKMGIFFKLFLNLSQNWLIFFKIWPKVGYIFQTFSKFEPKLAQILKNCVILFKIWPKIGPIGIGVGHFFLKDQVLCMLYVCKILPVR